MVLSRTALVASFALTALAADDPSRFIFPAEEGLKFYSKDTVDVTWESIYTSADLWLFCLEGGEVISKDKIDNVASFNGSQEYLINQGISNNECWFNLRQSGDKETLGINTPHFALSKNERESSGGKTTLGPSDDSSSTSTEAPSSTSDTSSDSSSETTTDKAEATGDGSSDKDNKDATVEKEDSGLSTGAKAGIGVGIALGVIALASVIVCIFMRRRRRARQSHGVNPANENDQGSQFLNSPSGNGTYTTSEYQPSELHGVAAQPTNYNNTQYYDPHKSPAPSAPQEMSAAPEMEKKAGAYEMPG